MFGATYQYNKTIRKYGDIVGSLFGNIKLKRSNNTTETFQRVPIELANHTSYLEREEKDPDIERAISIQLPRMSYELMDLKYDAARQLNPLTKIVHFENGDPEIRYFPIPYYYTYRVFVYTKFLEDQYQIAEQILPYFAPKFSLRAELVEGSNCTTGVDILFNSLDMSDSFERSFTSKQRQIIWTYTISIPGWIMTPDNSNDAPDNVIRWVRTGVGQNSDYREVANTYPTLAGTLLQDIEPTDPYIITTENSIENA